MTQIKKGITSVCVSVEILRNIICLKKDYIRNSATRSNENGEYVGSITDDSVIMCYEN